MRIGVDATPLLGARTGVGRYVAELVRHLPTAIPCGDELVATAFTVRGAADLQGNLPPGVSAHHRRFPARLLQQLWSRAEVPTVRPFVGPVDVFHATNFVLPPPGRARGVVTVHDLAYLHLPDSVSVASRRYVHLVPRSIARAAVVCVPSRSVADEVGNAYPSTAGKVVVTPLGVDGAWAETPRPDRPWLAERGLARDYLLFVGNLEPRKDLPTLLAAYRLLAARGGRDLPHLALAGPAGWGEPLDLTGLPDGLVVPMGHRPDGELRALVAGARALVFPSRYEGFGLPVLEALACGTPVLASDIPTTREIVGSQEDLVRFFPVGDVSALAELLITDSPGTHAMRRRRQEHASAWSWDRAAAATAAAYRRALA